MEARFVWDTWRRILTEDDLVAWVMEPDSRPRNPASLTTEELAILAEYASTPAATESNIGMYRRGLIRNSLGALSMVPLTGRIMRMSGIDSEKVAAEFARSTGYLDYGPNFWRNAGDFVSYLATLPGFASRARQDVVAIDAATIALARRLGESAPPIWPNRAATAATAVDSVRGDSARFSTNPAAVVVPSSCDLSAWIENPFEFDPNEELDPSPRHWLIYFPAADGAREYAELSERCARVFALLANPRTAMEVSLALGDVSPDDVHVLINSLAALGVVYEADELSHPVAQLPRAQQDSASQSANTLLSRRSGGDAAP